MLIFFIVLSLQESTSWDLVKTERGVVVSRFSENRNAKIEIVFDPTNLGIFVHCFKFVSPRLHKRVRYRFDTKKDHLPTTMGLTNSGNSLYMLDPKRWIELFLKNERFWLSVGVGYQPEFSLDGLSEIMIENPECYFGYPDKAYSIYASKITECRGGRPCKEQLKECLRAHALEPKKLRKCVRKIK